MASANSVTTSARRVLRVATPLETLLVNAWRIAEFGDEPDADDATKALATRLRTEMERCAVIVGSGTSADTQMAVYERHGPTEGRTKALNAVTDWLAAATLQ